MLLGRDRERREIERVLDGARSGMSGCVALVGEPGIGKSALLDHAADEASDMRVLRARGIEAEAQVPFASLLELLRPALVMLDRIPAPQEEALAGALALAPGHAEDRFAIGAATLSLLAAYADEGPVAVLVDDAHWLDDPSAQALLFAVRRLVADPIAVLIAVRESEASLLDGAGLPTLMLTGLSGEDALALLGGMPPLVAQRLHHATAGNPLALLELAGDTNDVMLAPEGAPMIVPGTIGRAFLRRAELLDDAGRRVLILAATSGSGDLSMLERAADALRIDLTALAGAERAGLVRLTAGVLEFRHPLVRSAVYANASAQQRREAHRALAGALPDRDADRRAWHLAAAAVGTDETAAAALEQAAARGRGRSAYAVAAAGFERAARLVADADRRAGLLFSGAESAWLAGSPDRAVELLDEGRAWTESTEVLVQYDELAGHIATQRGPVMHGHRILTAAASRADPDRAVAMLADAVSACFYAGEPAEMLRLADRVATTLSADASPRARFLAASAVGMARVVGGDAAAGAVALREAVALAESRPEIGQDLSLLPWLVIAPIFLRDGTGRPLFEQALSDARARGAVGVLPLVLCSIARDQATTDRWALAEATYREALGLARETGQRAVLAFGLAGLAWVLARRGREQECRALSAEALELCALAGVRLHEVWVAAAMGELELGLGDPAGAAARFEHQQRLLEELGITDADLSPAADLVDVYVRLGRDDEARQVAHRLAEAAEAKGQPWSLARAHRCQGLLADGDGLTEPFERALGAHAQTLDAFETARTRLAYGERLRRAGRRVLAREQLRPALDAFERLDARPWADRARTELAATGETLRRRTPSTIDELTPQELQIGLLLAGGRTTREAAAALFLSPKTIEYHLRHIYLKLDLHSREELARALAARRPEGVPDAVKPATP